MTQENERRKLRRSMNLAARGLVAAIMALTAAFLLPAAQAKDNPEDYTRVYTRTYDEVFQAAEKAAERLGWSITNADKDMGVVTGNGLRRSTKNTFEVHIEAVNQKPKTRVTIAVRYKERSDFGICDHNAVSRFFSELQKVMAIYE